MSVCTGMGQCCCIDIRAAFPCDVSKVPITFGVLGLLCVNCDRKGICASCSKYQECNLYRFLPCWDPSCMGYDERNFEEEKLPFSMTIMKEVEGKQVVDLKRKTVYARDSNGQMIVIRAPTYEEIWHFQTFEKRLAKRNEKAAEMNHFTPGTTSSVCAM